MTAAEAIADVITIVSAEVQSEVLRLAHLGRRVDAIAQATRLTRADVRAIAKANGFGYKNTHSPMLPPGAAVPAPITGDPAALARIALDYLQEHRDGRAAEDLGWQDQALCAEVDPEIFFPEKGGSTYDAKRVCRSCEVQAECLEYALEHDERFGIWGGLSEQQRRRLKRRVAA